MDRNEHLSAVGFSTFKAEHLQKVFMTENQVKTGDVTARCGKPKALALVCEDNSLCRDHK